MSGDSFASSWYRVADLKPRLRRHAQVHRHVYRGQVWFVLQDHQSGRFFRVSPAANLMLCRMDGRRTMTEILSAVGEMLGAERPTKGDAVRLLVQLHQGDLLNAALPPDMEELERRAERESSRRLLARLTNPMALRLPAFDPSRFLDATLWLARPIFTKAGFALWLALIVAAAILGAMHWPELTANISDRVFSSYNVLMLALLYPLSKALHELGHAYATRLGGGEVHETGVMLLVFFPVPYVDASSSSAFPERWRRMLVGAAGIMTELAIAALAMIAWVELPPGLARAACFNLILLCGVSTLVFNANPLLRFDGYYVFGDLLGIANLDQRSRRYMLYLIQRRAFGMTESQSPVVAPGEAKWLLGYGVTATIYRLSVTLAIAFLVAQQFLGLGILIAAWALVQMLVLPLLRAMRFILSSPALARRRRRAMAVTGGAFAAAAAALFALPLPYAAVAHGVVWVPEESVVRARADGFVLRLLATPDQLVAAGQPVIQLEDAVTSAQVDVYRAQAAVIESRFNAVNLIDRAQARLAEEQLGRARAQLARAEQRERDLVITAAQAGRFVMPAADTLPGRFVRQGELLGYVIGDADVGIRVVVPQATIDLVRSRMIGVELRHTETIDHSVPARLAREVPSALDKAPAPALAATGGGPMLLDPSSPRGERPLERWFEIEVRPDRPTPGDRIGGHVYARFDLGSEPVAWRILRALRQSMLRSLRV
ncbi:MAG: peptidase M50 [Alphaproteobacteria bacterium]|nr:peptidase M50 [Alphaproteobacteria bacterium]